MTKKNNLLRACKAILFAILAFTAIFVLIWMLCQNQEEHKPYEFEDGWTVSVNGGEKRTGKKMQEYTYDHIQKGDVVVMENTLPEDLEDGQAVNFLVYLSTLEVAVDGETIYSYGEEYAKKNWLVGSGYHFITLPDDAAGKPITITVEARETNAFTNMLAPQIASVGETYESFAQSNLIGVFVGMFLTLLGAVLLVVSAVAICYSKAFTRLLYIAVFSLLMGVWSMGNAKVLQIFGVDMAANTTMEYMTLYFAPITFILLVAEIRKDGDAWRRNVAYGAAALLTIFAVSTTILQFTNLIHYPRVLSYFHMFGVLSLLLVGMTGFSRKRKKDSANRALVAGIIALSISVVLDLARFNLQKYIFPDVHFLTYSVIPLGALVFIVMLLISYIFYVYNILVDRAEQEWLTERAFHDELCGTFNRTKCHEVFRQLDASKSDYAIVNLDLNGLKVINDTYGHAQGDELLKEFAQILQTSFDEIGEVFRMGGDEFVVVIREERFAHIDQCLNRMVKMEKRRTSELPFVIDSSYGVAKRSECPNENTEKVYSLADQRMYDMKTKKKINRRLR